MASADGDPGMRQSDTPAHTPCVDVEFGGYTGPDEPVRDRKVLVDEEVERADGDERRGQSMQVRRSGCGGQRFHGAIARFVSG